MLAKALAHYFQARLLLFDITNFLLKLSSCGEENPSIHGYTMEYILEQFIFDAFAYAPSMTLFEVQFKRMEQVSSLLPVNVSPDGIASRDEKVFRFAREKSVPLVMVTSGGYMKSSAKVIAESLVNLSKKCLVDMGGSMCVLLVVGWYFEKD